MPFLTIDGENKLAQNQSIEGGLKIANFVLANVPDLGSEPDDRIASLPDPSLIVDTLPFTKRGYVNPNQVVYSLVIGSNVGDYDFNWVGLVDEDGVLIAVSHVPTIQKRKNVGGVPGNTITRNFLVKYTGIQQITATLVPVETWQIDFSNRLIGIDERERLANLDIYGHEGFLDDGWKVIGSAGTYSVATGLGYVGGIRAKNVAPQEVITTIFPNEIWLNVSLQGDISDMTAVSELVIDTGPFEDYVDGNGVTHYLTKIADIDDSGEVIDGRSFDAMKKHTDATDPHPQYATDDDMNELKVYADSRFTSTSIMNVSGTADAIILSSKEGVTPITELNDFDEFSFIVTATNTSSSMTIKIDELDAVTLSGISSDTQIFATALLTVRYIDGSFCIAEQINPKTGNPVALIGEILSTSFAQTGACKMRFNAGELNRSTHPILFAKAQKTGLVDQALKDADLREYGGKWGDGDGSTTFTCPIYDGTFLRYADNGRGLDIGRELGSWQSDAIRNITGKLTGDNENMISEEVGGVASEGALYVENSYTSSVGGASSSNPGSKTLAFDASRIVPTADDNHPMSYAVDAEFLV